MKQIRCSVFETNSSSTHSLTLSNNSSYSEKYQLTGWFGEYGWGHDMLSLPEEKLSYLLTALGIICDMTGKWWDDDNKLSREESIERLESMKYFKWTKEFVLEYTGSELIMDYDDSNQYYPFGYIDHQSIESHILYDNEIPSERKYIPDVLYRFWSEDELEFKKNMTEFIFSNEYSVIIDNDNH